MTDDPDAEILIEMNRMRGVMEVRAVSAGDGLEVVFVAPSNAAQSDIHDWRGRSWLMYASARRAAMSRSRQNLGRQNGKGGCRLGCIFNAPYGSA